MSMDAVRDQLRRMLADKGPDLINALKTQVENDRQSVVESAEDSVLLILRDVRAHWEDGQCDGDRSCLGGAFAAWAGEASNGELALVLGRAIAMLADLLPNDAAHKARTAAAEARDAAREREVDPSVERALSSLSEDTDGALVLGPFPAGEMPDFEGLDLGSLLRGQGRP